MDRDTIQLNQKLGKVMTTIDSPLAIATLDKATRAAVPSKHQEENAFEYDQFFHERIEAKKRDNSYRVFKRVQRKSGLFPQAQEKQSLDDESDSRTITVWCSNDYLGLGQHPKLKKAVV
jgi:hypothetical protein